MKAEPWGDGQGRQGDRHGEETGTGPADCRPGSRHQRWPRGQEAAGSARARLAPGRPRTPFTVAPREPLRMTVGMLPAAKWSFDQRLNDTQNNLYERPGIYDHLLKEFLTKMLKFYKRRVKGTMFLISKTKPKKKKNHNTLCRNIHIFIFDGLY